MKKIDICIVRDEVYTEVGKITGYMASKAASDGTMYEPIATIEENDEILSSYFDEAVSLVEEICYIYLGGTSKDIDYTNISLHMPDNWHPNDSAVSEYIYDFVIHYIVSKWLMTVGGEVASAASKVQEVEYVGFGDNLRKILNRRNRPHRPYDLPNPNETDIIDGQDK